MKFAVKNMNTNKYLGPDNLTVEFNRKFWDVLSLRLVRVYNVCFEAGEICDSISPGSLSILITM